MNDADLQPAVAAEFVALADLLESATDDLTTGGLRHHFGTSIEGRSLRATDLNWSYGSGAALRGTAGAPQRPKP